MKTPTLGAPALIVLAVAGCGSSARSASTAGAPATTAAVAAPSVASPALDRCAPASHAVAAPPGTFPAGLLPQPSRVVGAAQGSARAIVALHLRPTLLALRANGVKLGYRLGDQDYEGIEAELQLQGSAGDIELQLKPAPGCPAATQVTSATG